MKKLLTYCFCMLLSLSLCLLMTPNIAVKATQTEDSIENNSIKFLAYRYPFDIKQEWVEFKFVDQGNNTAKLKLYANGKFISPNDLPENLALYHKRLFIKFTNIYGYKGQTVVNRGTSMRWVAESLESLTFTYDVDTIQIVRYGFLIPDFDTEGYPMYTYHGRLHSNLHNIDFNQAFGFAENTERWQFRVRKDGLYAEYLPQDRIPDGDYIIESAECSNRVLDVLSGNNIGMSNYIPKTSSQIFTLQYDELRKAYKIKLKNKNQVLHWDKTNGKNVIATDDKGSEEIGEQFWYLKDAGDGAYQIFNARNLYEFLNVDSNHTNVSVAKERNNLKQKFKFVKVDEKESLLDGEWRIVSNLNHNKSLNIHIGGDDPRLLTIWDNADVSQQKWRFEYTPYRNTYVLKNQYYNLNLVWDRFSSNSRSLRALPTDSLGHDHWILEYVGDGYYMFKNYMDPNMVIDVGNSQGYNGNEIQVYARHNGSNQKFKIIR